jgi:SAM-dependent methyltransferase
MRLAAIRRAIGADHSSLLVRAYRRIALAASRRRFARLPLRETFEAIYDRRVWGGESQRSGRGSGPPYADQYASMVSAIRSRYPVRRIVDLGCGDFSVGRQLVGEDVMYVGVDIVRHVVELNRARYGGPGIEFMALDITQEVPPDADLALLRQVLQHLSNHEIRQALRRCGGYPIVLVTEHVPAGRDWQPNRDKPHGPDTRLYDGSGVKLESPPFSLPVEEIDAMPYHDDLGGVLRTVLVRGSDLRSL